MALGIAVLGGVIVLGSVLGADTVLNLASSVLVFAAVVRFSLTYNVTKMAEMVTKRTTATDRITRHIHERDVRFLELNETPTSVSNFSIFRKQRTLLQL